MQQTMGAPRAAIAARPRDPDDRRCESSLSDSRFQKARETGKRDDSPPGPRRQLVANRRARVPLNGRSTHGGSRPRRNTRGGPVRRRRTPTVDVNDMAGGPIRRSQRPEGARRSQPTSPECNTSSEFELGPLVREATPGGTHRIPGLRTLGPGGCRHFDIATYDLLPTITPESCDWRHKQIIMIRIVITTTLTYPAGVGEARMLAPPHDAVSPRVEPPRPRFGISLSLLS